MGLDSSWYLLRVQAGFEFLQHVGNPDHELLRRERSLKLARCLFRPLRPSPRLPRRRLRRARPRENQVPVLQGTSPEEARDDAEEVLEHPSYPFVEASTPQISEDRFKQGEQFFYQLQCLSCHVLGDPSIEGANKNPTAPKKGKK